MIQLHYFPGNANFAPHIMLEEIGVPHELVLVDRANNGHKTPGYLKLNPTGRIPVMVDGDFVLYESAAICLHLSDCHPEAGLAPALGTQERAQMYKWLMYLTNTLQAEVLTYHYTARYQPVADAVPAAKALSEEKLGGMFDLIEAELADGRTWVAGDFFSIADIYLFMNARFCRMIGNPPKTRPNLKRLLDAVAARPATIRAGEAEGLAAPYYA